LCEKGRRIQKSKLFRSTFFKGEVLRSAIEKFGAIAGAGLGGKKLLKAEMQVVKSDGDWQFDEAEEFFAEYKASVA
jgi:hypothetical protein